jgi:hypothetical protein
LGLDLISILIYLGLATHSKPTVQLPSASLASVEVSFADFQNRLQKTNKQKTDSGVYRVAPATKNSSKTYAMQINI